MWDFEGKDADFYAVRLSKYPDFFRKYVLGEDVYLIFRGSNPRIEVIERKVFLQALELIPVANDETKGFMVKAFVQFSGNLPITGWVDPALTLRCYERSSLVRAR
jgi:phosphoenolpyruvate carboxylase